MGKVDPCRAQRGSTVLPLLLLKKTRGRCYAGQGTDMRRDGEHVVGGVFVVFRM